MDTNIRSEIINIIKENSDMEFSSCDIAPIIHKSKGETSRFLLNLTKDGFLIKVKLGIYKLHKIKILLDVINEIKINKKITGQKIGNLIKKIHINEFNWNDQLIEKTKFLDEYYTNICTSQRFYHVWFNENTIENCPICKNPKKIRANSFSLIRYNKSYGNYMSTCGSNDCYSLHKKNLSSKAHKELHNDLKRRNEWIKKVTANNNKKYGVDWITQTESFLSKSQETCLKNHGVTSGSKSKQGKENSRKTCLKNHGVEFYFQSDDKKIKTNEFYNKLGVEHNTQIPEIFAKMLRSRYKWKDYIMPSGKIVKIQGYEYLAIDALLKSGVLENDIIIDNKEIRNYIGHIWYTDILGKKHLYYPDIFIISMNKIIEVKSTYTYKCDIDKNKLKKMACEKMGLLFEYDIYDKNKNKII